MSCQVRLVSVEYWENSLISLLYFGDDCVLFAEFLEIRVCLIEFMELTKKRSSRRSIGIENEFGSRVLTVDNIQFPWECSTHCKCTTLCEGGQAQEMLKDTVVSSTLSTHSSGDLATRPGIVVFTCLFKKRHELKVEKSRGSTLHGSIERLVQS